MRKLDIKSDSMDINQKDIENVMSVIESKQLNIFNSEVISQFESKFERILSKKEEVQTVMLPNCTSAIFIALQLLNLKEGDEIIVPNLTHSSSIYPIIYNNRCKIRVCNFKKESYDLDVDHLKTLINKNTKAVMVCYLHGFSFNISEIKEICDSFKIKLIEDAAQGLGVKNNQKLAGTIGDYGCFSFGINKLLRMGEGGALSYKNKDERDLINSYRHVGEIWKKSGLSTVSNNTTYEGILRDGIDYRGEGFNFRCNPLNVALGLSSLDNLENIIEQRKNKLRIYQQSFKDILGIKLINNDIYQSAPITAWFLLNPDYYKIDNIILKCVEVGIPVGKFKYPTVTNIEAFKDYILNINEEFNNSENIRDNSLILPLYENLSVDNIHSICEALLYILDSNESINIDKSILHREIEGFDGYFIR